MRLPAPPDPVGASNTPPTLDRYQFERLEHHHQVTWLQRNLGALVAHLLHVDAVLPDVPLLSLGLGPEEAASLDRLILEQLHRDIPLTEGLLQGATLNEMVQAVLLTEAQTPDPHCSLR